MLWDLRLFLRYYQASIRGQMQYRASFFLWTLANLLTTAVEFLGIYVLFARFKSLGRWSLAEVAVFYGLVNISFALAEAFGRGFDTFSGLVKQGGFDRLLVRPLGTVFQIAASQIQLMRIGRFAQALIVLIWALHTLQLDWHLGRTFMILFAVLGGACLFYGLFIIQAAICFWSTESLELLNILTYGGTETGRFPLSIYQPWFQKFFIFVVPLACVTYFPALAILGRPDAALGSPPWFHTTAPLAGLLFLLAAAGFWKVGVKHYRSTGS